jgi:hypothetical protein
MRRLFRVRIPCLRHTWPHQWQMPSLRDADGSPEEIPRMRHLIRLLAILGLGLFAQAIRANTPASTTSRLCPDQRVLVGKLWHQQRFNASPRISAIMQAAFDGRIVDVRKGLATLPAKARARWQDTALATAIVGNQAATVEALLSDGARPNQPDWLPPLGRATYAHILQAARHDPRFGGDRAIHGMQKAGVIANHGKWLPPPLFQVMPCDQLAIAKALLNHGASVHTIDRVGQHGMDPLVPAALSGDDDIIALLLEHDADSCQDDRQMAALAHASGHRPIPTVASIARKQGVDAALVRRLRCPAH